MHRLRECTWEEFFDVHYLAGRLARNRELAGVFFFRAAPSSPPLDKNQYWNEVRYLAKVEKQLWQEYGRFVRYGFMAPREKRWNEKQSDVWLACEMLAQAYTNCYDVAILLTADTDLVPAVHHVQMLNKRVELVVFRKSRANVSQLVNCADGTTTARQNWFRPY